MADSADQSHPPVKPSEVYHVITSLHIYSEQVRWNRLNIFLVISSVFIAAWVGVLAGTKPFSDKTLLLIVLCLPGIVLGALWYRLGSRGSKYLDDLQMNALAIETHFPNGIPRPFHDNEKRRGTVRKGSEKFTGSAIIVSAIPAAFAVLFMVLAAISYRFNS